MEGRKVYYYTLPCRKSMSKKCNFFFFKNAGQKESSAPVSQHFFQCERPSAHAPLKNVESQKFSLPGEFNFITRIYTVNSGEGGLVINSSGIPAPMKYVTNNIVIYI
jgi:hypothetical protein